MKKTTKRTLTSILCALILGSSLVSCAQTEADKQPQNNTNTNVSTNSPSIQQTTTTPSQNEKPTQTPSGIGSGNSSNTSDNTHNINADKYEEQIKYYMELTESLQAELLKLKEDFYIDECEYQLQISSLEQTIQNLNDTIASLRQDGPKLPVSGNNNVTNDMLSTKSSFKYSTSGGSVTITGYTGTDIDIEIPSNIDGLPVTKIGEEAFKNALVRSVTIPSSVREIDWFAFSGCTCLESITIPSSVLTINYGAFDYCPKAMKVYCEKGSYAEAYALSWGMSTVAK